MQDSTFDLQHANGKLDSTKSNPLYKVGEKEKGVQYPEESMRRPQTKVDQIPSETEKGFVRVTQYIPNVSGVKLDELRMLADQVI